MVETTVNAAIHTFVAFLLLMLGRKWLRGVWLGAYGALLLLLFSLPFSWENTLVGFQVQFYFLVLFALGHIWLTLRSTRFSPAWGLGQVCGVLGILSMASGFLSAAALLAVLGWTLLTQRRWTAQQAASFALALAMCIAGWQLRNVVPGHDVLKAHTLWEFLWASLRALAWPSPALLPFVAIPGIWFGVRWLRGRTDLPDSNILVGLIVWVALQCLTVAYGRANAGVISSRYLDLYAINVALGFIVLAHELGQNGRRIVPTLWLTGTAISLIAIGTHDFSWTLPNRRHETTARDERFAAYIKTQDPNLLLGHSWPEIAYPNASILMSRVASSKIRAILPASVRLPIDLGDDAAPAMRQMPSDFTAKAREPIAFSSYAATGSKPITWRSATMPDTAASFLRFQVAGDLGPKNPHLRLVAKSAAGETALIPDEAPGQHWKSVVLRRPRGAWWIEAYDDDPVAWFAFTQPVEIGPLSLLAHKILKFHAVFLASGFALVLVGLLGWARSAARPGGAIDWLVTSTRQRGLPAIARAARWWARPLAVPAGSPGRCWWIAAAAALLLFKLWLVGGQTVLANGHALYDDQLFLRLARHILRGEWLGPYGEYTMMKGPAYPLWIAGVFLTGVPLFTAQHLFYAAGCALLVLALRPLIAPRGVRFGIFAVLLFNPMTYESAVHGRVLRQDIYHSLMLCGLAGLVALYARRDVTIRKLVGWAILAGVALAGFWLTREEGVWLAPLVGLVWLALFWRLWHERPAGWRLRLTLYLVPAIAWLGVVGVISGLNAYYYGWFGTVEFRAPEFRDAYGALCRVKPREWQRYIPVQREVRERIYAVSPAFAELRPNLEGRIGDGWAANSEFLTGKPRSEREIAGGWFMWALREAVIDAGHDHSAAETLAYYERMAREINAACDDGRLAAVPRRSGFLPPWNRDYTAILIPNLGKTARFFLTLDGFTAISQPSTSNTDLLILFGDLTRERLTPIPGTAMAIPAQQRWLDRIRVGILEQIGHGYQLLIVPAAIAAALAFLVATILAAIRRRADFWLTLNVGIIGACAAMVAINALVDTTSFPATSTGAYTANYPLYLLFLWTAWLQLRSEFSARVGTK